MIEFILVAAMGLHAENHDWYKNKRIPDNPFGSCCNKKDCRRAEAYRVVQGGAMFKIKSGWVFVPDRKIKYESPDGEPHYCGILDYYGKDISRCGFIPPGQV